MTSDKQSMMDVFKQGFEKIAEIEHNNFKFTTNPLCLLNWCYDTLQKYEKREIELKNVLLLCKEIIESCDILHDNEKTRLILEAIKRVLK